MNNLPAFIKEYFNDVACDPEFRYDYQIENTDEVGLKYIAESKHLQFKLCIDLFVDYLHDIKMGELELIKKLPDLLETLKALAEYEFEL